MDLKTIAINQLRSCKKLYTQDLGALSEADILDPNLGGKARTPIDFTYEVVHVNRMIAGKIKGEEPAPSSSGDGWMVAPEDFRSKVAAIAGIEVSIDELISVVEKEQDMTRTVTMMGQEKSVFEAASFAGLHTMYHDAQLNYLQSIRGDDDMHWK